MAATSYDKVLARNIRAARSRAGLNQELVAARMRALGFGEWRQSTVGRIERGQRRVTAEEIMWLAWALQTNLLALMKATEDDGLVESPAGEIIGVRSVGYSLGGMNDYAVTWPGGGDKPEFAVNPGSR